MEERITRLEGDFAVSMQQVARSLNELESTQYDQTALLRAHSRDWIEMRQRMATVEMRLNGMDEKITDLQTGQQQMNDKLDTVIDLLTKQGE